MITYALPSDIPFLVAMEKYFPGDQLDERRYKLMFKKSWIKIFIGSWNAKPVSAMVLYFSDKNKIARVYSLVVRPYYRGHGIATMLMTRAENEARQRDYKKVVLEVRTNNIKAISLYYKLGYRIFGYLKNYYEFGEDAFRMEKTL